MGSSIRLAVAGDAAAVATVYRPFVASTPISFEIDPPDEGEMRRRIQETLNAYPWLVYESDGVVVGYAYATTHRVRAAYRWSVDAAVYVDAAHHRRGIGRRLYAALFAILARQGFFNAYAGITLPNRASVALHEAVGFQPVGTYRQVGYKTGAWHDVGWWQLALQAPTADPAEPTALSAIQSSPDWPAMLSIGSPPNGWGGSRE
jgi:phosphinothricin acetyltransferase